MNRIIMSAEDLLDAYWERGVYPIDPEVIAQKVGIKVNKNDALAIDGLSGKLEIKEDAPPIIWVNSKDLPIRQRFTIAHELGHYFCGHDSSPRCDPAFNLSPIVSKSEERQANDFAARLLMPKNYLEYFIFKEKITDIEKLANIFQVSSLALHFRLKNLGLI